MHAQANGSTTIVVQWATPQLKTQHSTIKQYQVCVLVCHLRLVMPKNYQF